MALAILKRQLTQLIGSMMDEKFLNDYYYEIEMLRTSKNPTFIVDILTTACEEATKNLRQLECLLNEDEDDINYYEELDKFAMKLHSCTSSVGAERVVRAVQVLRHYCWMNIKKGCLKAVAEIRQEFLLLESKFQRIIELEKQILAIKAEEKK